MTKRERKNSIADPAQSARFIEAARELGCDESPDAFEAAVKKVARHTRTANNEENTSSCQDVPKR